MFSLKRKWLIIQAYKHNEELHREWSHSYVLEDNDDYFVAASIRASVVESDGRKWHTKEPAIFILPKKVMDLSISIMNIRIMNGIWAWMRKEAGGS